MLSVIVKELGMKKEKMNANGIIRKHIYKYEGAKPVVQVNEMTFKHRSAVVFSFQMHEIDEHYSRLEVFGQNK